MRSRGEPALLLLQPRLVLRAGQGNAHQKARSEREAEREASLPSATHGGGPYQCGGLVALHTSGKVWRRLNLETTGFRDFVRPWYMADSGTFRLGKRLQTSEVVARVPNLCGPAPSGTRSSTQIFSAGDRE